MTDLAADAALVAEALGAEHLGWYGSDPYFGLKREGVTQFVYLPFFYLQAVACLVRRLRETEQERDEVETRLVGMNRAWNHDLEAKRVAEQERDELRDVVRGLEQALTLATSGRGTGPSGCIAVAAGPDAIIGGYGVASVPVKDWMDAQDDFGRRPRRNVG